jgi:hypothetical protein
MRLFQGAEEQSSIEGYTVRKSSKISLYITVSAER